jgi:integrase
MTPKTLANHKSNVRAVLRRFASEEDVPVRGVPLSPEWAHLREGIVDYRTRAITSSLMRYSSAHSIRPERVDETVMDALMCYRAATTALASNAAVRPRIARARNSCIGVVPGWPSRRLLEPLPKTTVAGPLWQEFPAGLRRDIEDYLRSLEQIRRIPGGRRRPLPITSMMSFCELLDPDLVERVLGAYWPDDGEEPGIYVIELASFLLDIAKQTHCLDAAGIARLEDMRAELEEHRPVGLTEKNMAVIRQVLSSDVWRLVVQLPWVLMREADVIRERAPMKAAGLAQLAVAIGILTVFPIRLANLGSIRIGENLIRPGGPGTPSYWLQFSRYDVKNRIRLETVFDAELTTLIDNYIQNHLHVPLRGSNEPWLFPGARGNHKGLATLSSQITKRIQKATGLRITVHQFRHAAAALILTDHPGNYEYVRRILGHRNIQTTINFYVGLETALANQEFGQLVRQKMRFDPEAV